MPSLSERLKSLGVSVGTENLPKAAPAQNRRGSLIKTLPGEEVNTIYGQAYVVTEHIAASERYGEVDLHFNTPPELLAAWAGEPGLIRCDPRDLVYIDIETTGLGTGAGILAFLIGAGRYEGEKFILNQYFLRDPGEEAAFLAALSAFTDDHMAVVSFNGRVFDTPILNNRYLLNGLTSPFKTSTQLDLLQLARKLWRGRLPSRTLLNLEAQILGATRTQEDVPGWVIPQLYRDYLLTGDAGLVKSVFYHNAKDILAMVGLLNYLGVLLQDPVNRETPDALDLIGIGQIHESLGRLEEAMAIYYRALEHELPGEARRATMRKLAMMHKKREDWEAALKLWEAAARDADVYACVELAKYHEHRSRQLDEAYFWVEMGRGFLTENHQGMEWGEDLEHRLERIREKMRKAKQNRGEAGKD